MEYFAAKTTEEIGSALVSRVENFYKHISESGRLSRWRKSHYYNYVTNYNNGSIEYVGENGEYRVISINHYRNILKHLKILATQNKPALKAKTINTDVSSIRKAEIAQGLLEYYFDEMRLSRHFDRAIEYALAYDAGYVVLDWDVDAGNVHVTDEAGKEIKTGDPDMRAFSPIDIIFDHHAKKHSDCNWYIIRRFQNKYDLAANQSEDVAQQIIEMQSGDESWTDRTIKEDNIYLSFDECDLVPVYQFRHKKTASVPNGRVVTFVGDLVLLDGDLPFDNVGVFRLAGDEDDESPFGYTIGYDLLQLQEGIDKLYSTLITNECNFGLPTIINPEGNNLTVTDIVDGMKFVNYDHTIGPPTSLSLSNVSPNTYKLIEMLERAVETLSAITSVTRGDAPSNLKSGSALALVESMAIRFNSGLEKSYIELVEDVGTGLINILREYADVKRVVAIVGKTLKSSVKEWDKSDLDGISRVTAEVTNAVQHTTGGRMQLAENLLANNMVDTPEQYIQVMTTGRLDPVVEGERAELNLIREENEMLSEGAYPSVIATDDHMKHLKEHKAVLSSPISRSDVQITQNTLNHMMEHIDQLRETDPSLLQMLGQTPLPPLQSASAMPEQQAGEQMESAPSIDVMQSQELGKNVKQPNMPTNPLTGEQYSNQDGGLR